MRIKKLTEKIAVPDKVTVSAQKGLVTVKGPKGELVRQFTFPRVEVAMEEGKLAVFVKNANKKDKTQLGTVASHITNMIKGVTEGHKYRLKICSGHFPMTVEVKGNTFTIKNFLGEKIPRVLQLKEGASVKVEGSEITVESNDIEKAGQVAADIELLTRIVKRDIRIFQDGIYMTHKSKRELA
jgi:large subunit ribosomal protein L6